VFHQSLGNTFSEQKPHQAYGPPPLNRLKLGPCFFFFFFFCRFPRLDLLEETSLQSIRYSRGKLELLDQKKLPAVQEYVEIADTEGGWSAIRTMQVRGAPAIAIAGALSLAVEAHKKLNENAFKDASEAANFIVGRLDYLRTSRPTAVNLFEAADRLSKLVTDALPTAPASTDGAKHILELYIQEAERMLEADIATNKAIGQHGAAYILKLKQDPKVRVITHCNTGSLATAGYGTALGVVRALHEKGELERAFCTETRPYNQGARLTALELVYEKIPGTLVTDSMAAALMASSSKPHAVVVGADRVAANGDTANKIGTYQLAISAKFHGIPFFVAAPVTTIDLQIPDGAHIKIEERPGDELTCINGSRVAAEGIGVWNPAFDVTPHSLIDGIITEWGVITKDASSGKFEIAQFLAQHRAPRNTSLPYLGLYCQKSLSVPPSAQPWGKVTKTLRLCFCCCFPIA
jgi:methylthioribose-1-phosphate isomerase